MYIIKQEKFILFPLAYNEFCKDISSICKTGTFAGGVHIERVLNVDSIKDIISFIEQNSKIEDIFYVIDMRNIVSYVEHSFSLLKELKDYKIIIYGAKGDVEKKIDDDLGGNIIPLMKNIKATTNIDKSCVKKLEKEIESVYITETAKIVQWMSRNISPEQYDELMPLDSSGVYCNMYVDAKKLFLDPTKCYFILYLMILEVAKYKNKNEIDALISASRNGANIANIIGWLLDIKVVHCINLGPKFSLSMQNINKDIRERKKYFYIFDFMCLGTEVKVLNSILTVKGARLEGGMGIANYIVISHSNKEGVIGKMHTLIDTKSAGLDYKIAGTKEDICTALRKGKNKDESGIRKI